MTDTGSIGWRDYLPHDWNLWATIDVRAMAELTGRPVTEVLVLTHEQYTERLKSFDGVTWFAARELVASKILEAAQESLAKTKAAVNAA
ncbi:hypothetical protein [Nocardia sp.]|nr:hypothetical protein [Nocardia sp.]